MRRVSDVVFELDVDADLVDADFGFWLFIHRRYAPLLLLLACTHHSDNIKVSEDEPLSFRQASTLEVHVPWDIHPYSTTTRSKILVAVPILSSKPR